MSNPREKERKVYFFGSLTSGKDIDIFRVPASEHAIGSYIHARRKLKALRYL